MTDKQPLPGLPKASNKIIRQNRCENCAYAEREGGVSKNYECHKNPPAVGIITTNKGPIPIASFPIVRPEQWCGGFEPKSKLVN